MQKTLFDSHCHLYDSHYAEYKEELIKEIKDSEIELLTDIGTDFFTNRQVLEDVRTYDFCYGAVGYYPEDTGVCPADIYMAIVDKTEEIPGESLKKLENMSFSDYEALIKDHKREILAFQKAKYFPKYEKLKEIVVTNCGKTALCQNRAAENFSDTSAKAAAANLSSALPKEWITEPPLFSSNAAPVMSDELLSLMADMYRNNDRIVAIGEIGLDYHDPARYAPRDVQRYWFKKQLRMAVELGAPVCIHTRDADEETFNILKEEALGRTKVLIHCYSGSAELAKQYVRLGAMISLSGTLTYKNARRTVEVAKEIPVESLLIETDAPYLTPVPGRGQTNKPFYVQHTCAKLAEIKGISYEEAAAATNKNAKAFYGIDKVKIKEK